MKPLWPEGKTFAFSVFDDTDLAVPGNYEKVYDFLAELGFRTTKSVWPNSGHYQTPRTLQGSTCEDSEYLEFVLALQKKGFEIGFHNAFDLALERAEIVRSLDEFKRVFGQFPRAMSNHASSSEGIYWGEDRLDGVARWLYRALRGFRKSPYEGHLPGQPRFWGDHCQEKIEYVRNFVFSELNTLRACPEMPYHDPNRPLVRQWFASTEGPSCESFLKAISEKKQDRLEREGGACIMYTHFALGFQSGGELNSEFRRLMTRLSKKPGWFVPVSPLLDYVRSRRGEHELTFAERARLQWKWMGHKFRVGGTS